MTPLKEFTFSDLTIGEINLLIKDFFQASFVCLLVFGIPYALFVGVFWGAESVFSGGELSWLPQVVIWGVIIYLLIKNLPDTLKYFGDMFQGLSAAAASVSRPKQLIGLVFVIGYFYSSVRFPNAWFWFTVLIFMPAGFTYDHYKKILKQKAENQVNQDTSPRMA